MTSDFSCTRYEPGNYDPFHTLVGQFSTSSRPTFFTPRPTGCHMIIHTIHTSIAQRCGAGLGSPTHLPLELGRPLTAPLQLLELRFRKVPRPPRHAEEQQKHQGKWIFRNLDPLSGKQQTSLEHAWETEERRHGRMARSLRPHQRSVGRDGRWVQLLTERLVLILDRHEVLDLLPPQLQIDGSWCRGMDLKGLGRVWVCFSCTQQTNVKRPSQTSKLTESQPLTLGRA